MKKILCGAMLACLLSACYTPLNNSGVATTKPWLEVSAKKLDFDGKQYDSCYQFNLHFWPQEATEAVDLKKSCVNACCWRSDKSEVTLDFNKDFDARLAYYGRARKYTPGKITFKVTHSNLVNTTKVTTDPKGAVSNNGLVKLTYKEYENPARLKQIEEAATRLQTRRNAYLNEQRQQQAEKAAKRGAQPISKESQAKALLSLVAGPKIDKYFYQMNKSYNRQGAVFMLSERLLQAQELNTQGGFTVYCHAKARTGVNTAQLKASSFPCGKWRVDLETQTVQPDNAKARQIWGK